MPSADILGEESLWRDEAARGGATGAGRPLAEDAQTVGHVFAAHYVRGKIIYSSTAEALMGGKAS